MGVNEICTKDENAHSLTIVKLFRFHLEDMDNKAYAFFYVLFLIGSLAVLVFIFLRRTVLVTMQDVYNDLCAAVAAKDTVKSMKIIKKYPHLINKFYGDSQYTPFLIACLNAQTQLVKFMIEKGADVNLKSLNGENALYLATYFHVKHQEVADATCMHTLYYAGVNINEPNSKGLTALQLASYFGHHKLVRWLLRKGADPNLLPSPLLLAREQGHTLTTTVLEPATHRSITH